MATVTVVEGDITKVESDAIATLANPFGMWFGEVKLVIYDNPSQAARFRALLGS